MRSGTAPPGLQPLQPRRVSREPDSVHAPGKETTPCPTDYEPGQPKMKESRTGLTVRILVTAIAAKGITLNQSQRGMRR